MSQKICSAMFTDLTIWFYNNSINTCSKTKFFKFTKSPTNQKGDAFLENEEVSRRRASMLIDNTLPSNSCESCTRTGENGFFKLRNKWTNDLSESEKNDLVKKPLYKTFSIGLNNSCDLACVYCGPVLSSTWNKHLNNEIKKYGYDNSLGVKILGKTNIKKMFDNETKKEILESLYDYLKRYYSNDEPPTIILSGGEPTNSVEYINFINHINTILPGNKIKYSIMTNGNTTVKNMERLIKLINNTPNNTWTFCMSIDDIEDRCEAIRYGLNWKVFLNNFDLISNNTNAEIKLQPAPNIFSIPTVKEYLIYFNDLFSFYKKEMYINNNYVAIPGISAADIAPEYVEALNSGIDYLEKINNHSFTSLKMLKKMCGVNYPKNIHRTKLYFDFCSKNNTKYDYEKLFPHITQILKPHYNNS